MKVSQTSQFKKDIEKQQRRETDLSKLKSPIDVLLSRVDLPPNIKTMHSSEIGAESETATSSQIGC